MTWLEGRTEGGTVLPVQITEDGRLVAQGLVGGEGPPGPPGEQGPQGPQGEYGPGDDVDLGSATFAGRVNGGASDLNNRGVVGYNNSPTAGTITANTYNEVGLAWQAYNSSVDPNNATSAIYADGSATFAGEVDVFTGITSMRGTGNPVFQGKLLTTSESVTSTITSDGSAAFAGNKCGFTVAGEIYFTSRGTRYKIEVAGGLCNPVEFTREMQLRELAEALKERIDEKRKPRPTDSVPED